MIRSDPVLTKEMDVLTETARSYNEFVSGRSANGLPSGEASGEIGGRASLM